MLSLVLVVRDTEKDYTEKAKRDLMREEGQERFIDAMLWLLR